MNRRDLVIFLCLEIFAILWAAALFARLDAKILAGALAGAYFVLSGLYMLWRARRWPRKWQSVTWYMLFIHVFAISLPMLVARYFQRNLDFADVRVLGFSGPGFHRISTAAFSLLMLATVVDWIRAKARIRN